MTCRFWTSAVLVVLAAAAAYRVLVPPPAEFAHTPLLDEYDYVVVGGGSAGAVAAARLAEGAPDARVLLLEAGPSDSAMMEVAIPAGCSLLQRTKLDWQFTTQPQAASHGSMHERRSRWPRGKTLGGSSSINYMVYVRGAQDDYDKLWGVSGWSFADVLPFFRKSENYVARPLAANETHRATGGPLTVSKPQTSSPLVDAFIASGKALGLARNEDYNGAGGMMGIAHCDLTIKDGVRASSAAAFLRPALARAAAASASGVFHVRTFAHVTRVVTETDAASGKVRAVGVEFADTADSDGVASEDSPRRVVRATTEVVLSAGAVGSPHVLMLSGIGPEDVLAAAGIETVVDLPGVGRNLRDHLMVPVRFPTKDKASGHLITKKRAESLTTLLKYLVFSGGLLTTNGLEGTAFYSTGTSDHLPASVPDVQIHMIATGGSDVEAANIGTKPEFVAQGVIDDPDRWQAGGINFLPIILHPKSRGAITLNSSSPFDPPLIQPNYLAEQADVDLLVAAVHDTLKLAADEAYAEWIDASSPTTSPLYESAPDGAAAGVSYWEWHVRNFAVTVYHPVGTAKMGEPGAAGTVVDPQLRVVGVDGLRVADASIMPTLISGNTNAPCIMIGERVADFILSSLQGR
ncbi:glucose dehydrogenase [Thecamonas trahens ATCC 50062]|uniref:Glucose dehydrogenase n=1 Tax=Thecamonas trahens ATCC 50062 TaxID=461836 RepID=A0A0L0D3Z8_THETB|nr:glucose dehydrogenase [Thecamonas trahens ATCC 50062]KNC46816.1 glucose dehydrogenase [Thecamonas trahens ATCC 50062]|eukprot:XP_013760091.1 glucose dehydrogenase [Thecamonas trahens ATCC 50062]